MYHYLYNLLKLEVISVGVSTGIDIGINNHTGIDVSNGFNTDIGIIGIDISSDTGSDVGTLVVLVGVSIVIS